MSACRTKGERYVDTKIWLRVPGGVSGWDLDDLNEWIDKWNKQPQLHFFGTFWDWLSWKTGETYYGFSGLWASRLLEKVHRIKGGNDNAWSG